MNEDRSVESCRIVSVCPCPPKMTSWCATSPGSRTECTRIPATLPPRTPSTDSGCGLRPRPPNGVPADPLDLAPAPPFQRLGERATPRPVPLLLDPAHGGDRGPRGRV